MKTKSIFILCMLCSITFNIKAQTKKRALFLGNSYTDVNNLPEIVKQLALSAGDTLIYSKNAPGGYTFQMHSTNATSIGLIQAGNWDYVVLQEQSQLPAFPEPQVVSQVYPYAHELDSVIKAYNPCATTLFFMTWGRKFGDASNCASYPPICTYEGMDSLLQLRYTIMAQNNGSGISPVARVWHKIIDENSSIDLYSSDNSHPNNNGSFAAACTFYAVMFGKNPQIAPYNYTVAPADADTIKSVAKAVVADSLNFWYRFAPMVNAAFTYSVNGNNVNFTNTSQNAVSFSWNFGDGQSSTAASPTHTFAAPGSYTVQLIASDSCTRTDSIYVTITITATAMQQLSVNPDFVIYPNPANDILYISSSDFLQEIQILDFTGRIVMTYPVSADKANSTSVDIRTLPAGMYMARGLHSGYKKQISVFSKTAQ
ncbi:MAG: PKD domain-containing protein [Bacteroidetes bacterium]|nr:PKD domain-containing protein [Bacteroidota bacterium]